MDISPAQLTINKFGGAVALAKAIGRHPISIIRWTYPRARGGTGGLIPSNLQFLVLEKAKERGIKLRAGDLVGQEAA